ncbi:MAG: GNAT family N-acetyltransferase [Bacteroidia bacterium]
MTPNQYDLLLRPTVVADLPQLFQFQLDEEARHLAAFMSQDDTDPVAYMAKYTRLLSDPTIHNQTIVVDGAIAGRIAKYVMEGDAEITYWIDKACWGRGIATRALRAFLAIEPARPLFGRAAFDNIGSQKVLEAGGFVKIGTEQDFAYALEAEIAAFVYRLDS